MFSVMEINTSGGSFLCGRIMSFGQLTKTVVFVFFRAGKELIQVLEVRFWSFYNIIDIINLGNQNI